MAAKVTVVLDGMADYVQTDPAVDGSFRDVADLVAAEARSRCPVRTGTLARSIVVERARDPSGRYAPGWQVVATAPHAVYVHEGTRPHPISGNPLLAFHWQRIGQFVVLPHVNHPGTTAQPFLADAMRSVI